ncbi:MAG: hypothetical protein Q8J80_06335 [Gallionella sp.]|jgi:hypothetical protein|nr:hypothetical protein [Gallionella sp.]
MNTIMLVRVLVSTTHPEYRLVLPDEESATPVAPHVQSAIDHLGPWREISQDKFDCSDPEHLEAAEDIVAQGAYLRLITADYIGRVAISPAS